MDKTIYLEVKFDEKEWSDYENVHSELLLEDSGLIDCLKDGVIVKIFDLKNFAIINN